MKHGLPKLLSLVLALVFVFAVMPLTVSADDENDEDIVYHVRPVVNSDGVTVISAEKYHAAESEHFQLLWGDQNNSYITDDWIAAIFDMYEACWKLYIDDLGMQPPSLCTYRNGDQKTHYKVNIVVWGTGLPGYHNAADPNEWAAYGGIDYEGYGYMMCSRSAMESNSWALPHEFGHVTHFAQGYNSWASGNYLGPWYEAIGNWFREQYLYSDYYTAGGTRTDFSYLIMRASSLTAANGRAYYEAWPILQYLTENPDGLDGYGPDFVAKLLQNGSSSGYIYTMIAEHADAKLEDMLGYFAAHMATLDFEHQKNYMANMQNAVNDQDFFWQQFYTTLEATPGSEHTYAVPTERAPQQASYVVAPLKADGDTLSVTLRGMTDAPGAAWRACVVAVKKSGTEYSELFGDGDTIKVDVSGAKEVYLTVAATPAIDKYVKYAAFQSENDVPFGTKPRYPFCVELDGAEPKVREIANGGAGAPHPNGGGFVAKTAKVSESVYVGPDAKVLGNAVVTGNARIEDHAVVMGSARVSDNAVIDGCAVVAGSAVVGKDAYVGDSAVVTRNASVYGHARVIESAYVAGNYKVYENATAKGLALCLGGGALKGDAVADGDFFEDGGLTIGSGTAFGYFPSLGDSSAQNAYINKLRKTDGLILGYTFDKGDNEFLTNPQYGSTYAAVNGARWERGGVETAMGYYNFTAEDSITLDGQALSSNELQIFLSAMLKKNGGSLLSFEGRNGSLSLTSDEEGKLTFELEVEGEKVTLTTKSAVPVDEFTNIYVTFADGAAALTVGDITHDVVKTDICPRDIGATYGTLGGGFKGAVDLVRFYRNNAENVEMEVNVPAAEPEETELTTETAPAEDGGGCGSAVGGIGMLYIAAALSAAVWLGKKER